MADFHIVIGDYVYISVHIKGSASSRHHLEPWILSESGLVMRDLSDAIVACMAKHEERLKAQEVLANA